jgi:NADH-quinone oxidoreductase subunit L
MIVAHGAGAPEAAMIHLFAHAFFKACLFLSAGSIIHAMHQAQYHGLVHVDLQDIRNLGGLRKRMPFTFLMFLISGSSLAGLPLFSGFLSKDAILDAVYTWKGSGFSWRWLILMVVLGVSFITVLYTFRLVMCVFGGDERMTKGLSVMEPPVIMRMAMGVLALGSIWVVLSWSPIDYTGWLYESLRTGNGGHTNFMPLVSGGWVVLACWVAYRLFRKRSNYSNDFLNKGMYWDKVLDFLIGRSTIQIALAAERTDKKWIDGLIHQLVYVQVTLAHVVAWFDVTVVDGLVNALSSAARLVGAVARLFQGGKVQLYIFWAILAIIIFLIWILF